MADGRPFRTDRGLRHPGERVKQYRIRFGFRHGNWLLPRNIFIAVLYLNPGQMDQMAAAVATIAMVLRNAGQAKLADKIVFEADERAFENSN